MYVRRPKLPENLSSWKVHIEDEIESTKRQIDRSDEENKHPTVGKRKFSSRRNNVPKCDGKGFLFTQSVRKYRGITNSFDNHRDKDAIYASHQTGRTSYEVRDHQCLEGISKTVKNLHIVNKLSKAMMFMKDMVQVYCSIVDKKAIMMAT